MRTKYKPWALPYLNEHKEVQITLDEIKELNAPIYLEIGSGKGQFISNMAKKFPDINFIGVEKNVSCSGILAKKLKEEEINNAKMIYADGKDVTEAIKSNSVKYLFLNFSDPWPKKRHDKRRLTHDNFLKEYKRILMEDGELIFKTDNFDLFEFSLEKFAEIGFKIVSITRDYENLVDFDAMTEYEENFRNKGQKIARIVVRK